MSGWQATTRFLALRRNTTLLLAALVLAGTGEKLWLNFAPKYLETLGATVLIIGLFDALQTFLGAIYAYPGGWLTDRWGERRSLVLFNLLSLAGYTLVLVWPHWLALLIGAFLFLAWSALSLPATFAVVASSLSASQYTMGVGVQSMVRRVPMMVGPLVGGWLLAKYGWERGMQIALLGCIVLNCGAALVSPRSNTECSWRSRWRPQWCATSRSRIWRTNMDGAHLCWRRLVSSQCFRWRCGGRIRFLCWSSRLWCAD